MKRTGWVTANPTLLATLPHLEFPLKEGLPDLFVPQSTVLKVTDTKRANTWLWCYLERDRLGMSVNRFNPESLSAQRVQDLPRALERMSKQQVFRDLRFRTVDSVLGNLSRLLAWTDDPVHGGRFEAILSDPDVALLALKGYHTHLRQRVQGHGGHKRLCSTTANQYDTSAIEAMSTIHDRDYGNHIEALPFGQGPGVKPPKTVDVQHFMACVQGAFDSIVRLANLWGTDGPVPSEGECVSGEILYQSNGQEERIEVIDHNRDRLMEIGCIAFAALCLGDSGANLAQIQAYEAPEDLEDQLSDPERITLKQKVVKFRAGGKVVPVHLTATTCTRLRAYLGLRQSLIERLGCADIDPMFIQGDYASRHEIIGIKPINDNFTPALRARFKTLGIELPRVTARQLRVHRQGNLARKHNPKVVADMTGNTVETAIKAYNKIAEKEAHAEMTPFMANLTRVVRATTESKPTIEIAVGGCGEHGKPKPITENPLVSPDCKKAEGCFFCDKFSLHADEPDAAKLMSCKAVLDRINPAHGSGAAERVYVVVVDRIGSLLSEIRRLNPKAHERAHHEVVERGNLTRYWASKLQQLHMLGLLGPAPNRASKTDPSYSQS